MAPARGNALEADGPLDSSRGKPADGSAAMESGSPRAQSSGLPRWLCALGRLIGFLVLAGPAVVILAGVVLLPEYAQWKNDQYQRDLVAAQTADLETLRDVQEGMIDAATHDPVYVKALAMHLCNLWPTGEQVLEAAAASGYTPGVAVLTPHPRPAPPDDPYLRVAAKVQNPPTRRGLLLIAGGLMLFAVLLFAAAPTSRPAKQADSSAWPAKQADSSA